MKTLIATAALTGLVVLGGCSKQAAEGNNSADVSLNADTAAGTDANTLSVDNGLDNATGNDLSANESSAVTNNSAG